jgi:hypothetical protein
MLVMMDVVSDVMDVGMCSEQDGADECNERETMRD